MARGTGGDLLPPMLGPVPESSPGAAGGPGPDQQADNAAPRTPPPLPAVYQNPAEPGYDVDFRQHFGGPATTTGTSIRVLASARIRGKTAQEIKI